jgi:hypothetical protein
MTITPKCDTPGCIKPSVHVYVTEKILGLIRRAKRLCAGCDTAMHDRINKRRS